VLFDIPVSSVKRGCGKVIVEGVKVMMMCHSSRNRMAERWVLWREREGAACIGAMQVVTISQLY